MKIPHLTQLITNNRKRYKKPLQITTSLLLDTLNVFNTVSEGKKFFGYTVFSLEDIETAEFEIIIITSFQNSDTFKHFLVEKGIKEDKIFDISSGGWLKKIAQAGLKRLRRKDKQRGEGLDLDKKS